MRLLLTVNFAIIGSRKKFVLIDYSALATAADFGRALAAKKFDRLFDDKQIVSVTKNT